MAFDSQATSQKLAREAKIGLTVVALLVVAFVYVATKRLSGGFDSPNEANLSAAIIARMEAEGKSPGSNVRSSNGQQAHGQGIVKRDQVDPDMGDREPEKQSDWNPRIAKKEQGDFGSQPQSPDGIPPVIIESGTNLLNTNQVPAGQLSQGGSNTMLRQGQGESNEIPSQPEVNDSNPYVFSPIKHTANNRVEHEPRRKFEGLNAPEKKSGNNGVQLASGQFESGDDNGNQVIVPEKKPTNELPKAAPPEGTGQFGSGQFDRANLVPSKLDGGPKLDRIEKGGDPDLKPPAKDGGQFELPKPFDPNIELPKVEKKADADSELPKTDFLKNDLRSDNQSGNDLRNKQVPKDSFPPVKDSFPPVKDSFPPVKDSFPPSKESVAPGKDSVGGDQAKTIQKQNYEQAAEPKPPYQLVAAATDSYWSIASKAYGNGQYFRALHQFNRQEFQVANIGEGVTIRVPALDELKKACPTLMPGFVGQQEPLPKEGQGNQQKDSTGNGEAKGTASGVYRVKQGETLFSIAAEQLGQASRYAEIMKLNRRVLPANVNHLTRLKPGLRIQLPPR